MLRTHPARPVPAHSVPHPERAVCTYVVPVSLSSPSQSQMGQTRFPWDTMMSALQIESLRHSPPPTHSLTQSKAIRKHAGAAGAAAAAALLAASFLRLLLLAALLSFAFIADDNWGSGSGGGSGGGAVNFLGGGGVFATQRESLPTKPPPFPS